MDNDFNDFIVDLKINEAILTTLVDTILDSCRLGYDNEPRLYHDEKILTIIKTFYPDEYENCIKALRETEVKEGAANG